MKNELTQFDQINQLVEDFDKDQQKIMKNLAFEQEHPNLVKLKKFGKQFLSVSGKILLFTLKLTGKTIKFIYVFTPLLIALTVFSYCIIQPTLLALQYLPWDWCAPTLAFLHKHLPYAFQPTDNLVLGVGKGFVYAIPFIYMKVFGWINISETFTPFTETRPVKEKHKHKEGVYGEEQEDGTILYYKDYDWCFHHKGIIVGYIISIFGAGFIATWFMPLIFDFMCIIPPTVLLLWFFFIMPAIHSGSGGSSNAISDYAQRQKEQFKQLEEYRKQERIKEEQKREAREKAKASVHIVTASELSHNQVIVYKSDKTSFTLNGQLIGYTANSVTIQPFKGHKQKVVYDVNRRQIRTINS